MRYELRRVSSPEDWQSMHDIRRAVLFTPERRAPLYDENHPDDRAEGNVPYILLLDGRPVGVARLDVRGETATLRLVAIAAEEQGKGHGKVLARMIDAEARRYGVRFMRVNAAPDAVGYYEKMGWRQEIWDQAELVGWAGDCVQMTRNI